MSNLLRVMPYIQHHALAFWGGMAGLLLARIFEALIPYYLKEGIDRDQFAAATDTYAKLTDDAHAAGWKVLLTTLVCATYPIVASSTLLVHPSP